MENVNETPVTEEKPKSFLRKLIGWIIKLAIIGGVAYYIVGLRAEKEDKFIESVAAAAVQRCGGDVACIDNLKENFASCLSANYETRRSGKYNRKYILDEEGFYGCLDSHR